MVVTFSGGDEVFLKWRFKKGTLGVVGRGGGSLDLPKKEDFFHVKAVTFGGTTF